MAKSYLTVAKIGEGFYKEKGSKFLGFAIPCKDENEVKRLIEQFRKENSGACHVCSAFKLGNDGKHYRASDDGEPNNSAGQPILGQINSFGITQVLVAVARYYGGTKLGVGGLINAYRTAAKLALEDAGIVEEEITDCVKISCTYEQMPLIMKEIKINNLQVLSQNLDLNCELEISINQEQTTSFTSFLDFQKIKHNVN